MAESKITVARVKDKVGGREAEVSKLLYSDNGNIKTIGGDSAITVGSAKTLNGETKEQLLSNVNAATVGGKRLAEIQSRGKFGPIKLIMDARKHNPYYYTLLVTEDEELIFCGNQHSSMLLIKTGAESTNPHTVIPHPLKGLSRIKQVIGAWTTQYILYENGDLYGRGGNASYQLGINNTASQYDWVKITDNVDKLICESNSYKIGEGLRAAIKKDKSVWFWGVNPYGAAGMGNTTTLTTPTKLALTFLEAGDSVKDLVMNDCYYLSLFLITEKGKLYACGRNEEGSLGINDNIDLHISNIQRVALDSEKVAQIKQLEIIGTAELMRTFFLLNNGQLWGCGSDSNCALRGLATPANCSLPTLIL